MNKNKLIAILGIFILAVIVYNLSTRGKKKDYVFDNKYKISLKDIKNELRTIDFNDESPKDYFSKDVANAFTIKYFKFLQKRFKEFKTFQDHLDAVRKYLYSIMSVEEADKIIALYKKFSKYEEDMAAMLRKWGTPKSSEDAIDILRKMQEYRRKYFGKEIADILFGAEIKAKEYPIRRRAIVYDKNLYGAEKEEKLKELSKDMWGDEADSVEDQKPYDKYKSKLAIYGKDLSELEGEDKTAKIKEFREEIFPADVVKRLEDVDKQLEDEQKRDEDYAAEKSKIESDVNLDQDEKSKQITELQNNLYGDDADALRRRENIETGLEAIKSKYKK